MKENANLNGFGRFGLHLLYYYLDRATESKFEITHINDDSLSIDQIMHSILNDSYVRLREKWEITHSQNLVIFTNGENRYQIQISNLALPEFVVNKTGILLECSGKYTNIENLQYCDNLKRVYISATSLNADSTLIVGFNESNYMNQHKFISYGSCTVNAFIPLANSLHTQFKVIESDVNVIHNIPEYKLRTIPDIFERRDCTLSFMAPKLLNFINLENFNVNYTIVPITGVSRIDFRFKMVHDFEINSVIKCIDSINNKFGNKLYKIHENDPGPYEAILSDYSAEFVLEQTRKVGDNIYLSAYFDTENSVNRYYDLINSIERVNLN